MTTTQGLRNGIGLLLLMAVCSSGTTTTRGDSGAGGVRDGASDGQPKGGASSTGGTYPETAYDALTATGGIAGGGAGGSTGGSGVGGTAVGGIDGGTGVDGTGSGGTGSGWPHRPVGIETGVDGRLFVSSDASGIIIAIGYNGG